MSLLFAKLKPVLLSGAYHLGIFDILRLSQRSRVTILMYHRFSVKPEPFKLSQSVFKNQLEFLAKKYNFISFSDYLDALDEKINLPPNPILITIDDGFRDNYECAYPLLKKYDVPATIFLTTNFVSHSAWLWSNQLEYILKRSTRSEFVFPLGQQEVSFAVNSFAGWHTSQLKIFNYCCTLPNKEKDIFLDQLASHLDVTVPAEVTEDFLPLTWDQIREMHAWGVEFGSHTCSHPICSRLSDDELVEELTDSKREIEQNLSTVVDVFCYPNGQPDDYSPRVIQQVNQSGYRAAVTTVPGFNCSTQAGFFQLNRLSVGMDDRAILLRTLTRSGGTE